MNRTKIEWCHYTWNPITGCTVGCSYCYARKLVERFPDKYPLGFHPTFHHGRLMEPYQVKRPSLIFCCSMGDFWDTYIADAQREWVIGIMEKTPQHKYLILTKRPENIHIPEGRESLPHNLWLGVTCDYQGTEKRIDTLLEHSDGVQGGLFVSFEPLLGYIEPNLLGISWVIIGAQTNPNVQPEKKWVDRILIKAHGIPVFLKNNLSVIWNHYSHDDYLPTPRSPQYPKELLV